MEMQPYIKCCTFKVLGRRETHKHKVYALLACQLNPVMRK